MIKVSGRVQGVGFRYFAQREAQLLGISGYAKNLYDGTVEILAQGEDEILKEYIKTIKSGPNFGYVNDLQSYECPVVDKYQEFLIEY